MGAETSHRIPALALAMHFAAFDRTTSACWGLLSLHTCIYTCAPGLLLLYSVTVLEHYRKCHVLQGVQCVVQCYGITLGHILQDA